MQPLFILSFNIVSNIRLRRNYWESETMYGISLAITHIPVKHSGYISFSITVHDNCENLLPFSIQ